MKRDKKQLGPLAAFMFIQAILFGSLPAPAADTVNPTSVTVTNGSAQPVYANLILGQPPVTNPAGCTNLGQQITSVTDPRLVFSSSLSKKKVAFTLWTPGVTDQGYYRLAAGETITYQPQTFQCGSDTCSAAVTFNFLFTPNQYNGNPNNGCGGSTVFPNASSIAEASVNFGINGAVGSGCANADAADISAVNGINSLLELDLTGPSWPFSRAANGGFGTNADRPGVYGWAATHCVNSTGNPNPASNCAAPQNAPLAPASGQCTTPQGTQYPPIVFGGTSYCAELSDSSTAYPQGQCVSQRPPGVTGGVVGITFKGFYPPSAAKPKSTR